MTQRRGFTLLEMLVALALVALLLTLALPRYFSGLDRSRDAVLAENLRVTREAIDRFYADTGRYPASLGEMVERRYLRSLPLDPVINSTQRWVIVAPPASERGAVYDLKSGAPGQAMDGRAYSSL